MSPNISDDKDRDRIEAKIVMKLLRRRVIGPNKMQIDTVVNWFPTHQQGEVRKVIEKMARDTDVPIEEYGGDRRNIRLTDFEDAREYARVKGADSSYI